MIEWTWQSSQTSLSLSFHIWKVKWLFCVDMDLKQLAQGLIHSKCYARHGNTGLQFQHGEAEARGSQVWIFAGLSKEKHKTDSTFPPQRRLVELLFCTRVFPPVLGKRVFSSMDQCPGEYFTLLTAFTNSLIVCLHAYMCALNTCKMCVCPVYTCYMVNHVYSQSYYHTILCPL